MNLNAHQAAAILKVSPNTVRVMCADGRLIAENKGSKSRSFWRIKMKNLRAYQAAQKELKSRSNGHPNGIKPAGVPENFISAKEAAERIGVSVEAIGVRYRKGDINGIKHGGRLFVDLTQLKPRQVAPRGQRWAGKHMKSSEDRQGLTEALRKRIHMPSLGYPEPTTLAPMSPAGTVAVTPLTSLTTDIQSLKASVDSTQLHLNGLTDVLRELLDGVRALRTAWNV